MQAVRSTCWRSPFTSLERYDEALTAYDTYLQYRPGLIDSHIYTLKGDIYYLLGNYAQALANYQEAYRADPNGGSEALAVQVAVAYEINGDQETALALYQDIYNTSENGLHEGGNGPPHGPDLLCPRTMGPGLQLFPGCGPTIFLMPMTHILPW